MSAPLDLNEVTKNYRIERSNFKMAIRYLIATRKKLLGFKNWQDVKQAPGFSEDMIRRLQEAGFSIAGRSRADRQRRSAVL